MKWFVGVLAVLVLLLQYRIWLSRDGVRETSSLGREVAAQLAENQRLAQRNQQLAAEVRNLKQNTEAIEERARTDLGLIKGNETYYQVVPPAPAAGAAAPQQLPDALRAAR